MRTRTSTWFEAKVRYHKTMEDGNSKIVTDIYVFDALTWTEAEAKTIEYVSPFVSGDMAIMALGKAAYKEVIFAENDKADKYFKCKVNFITLDEKTATEKKSAVLYLVQAENIEDARKNVETIMSNSMLDYQISTLSETKVMDVVENG